MQETKLDNYRPEVAPASKLWLVVGLAIIVATTANIIFYYVLTLGLNEPLLFPEQFPPPETSPMPVTDVIIFSVIFSLGAGIVFMLVANFSKRPIKTYLIVAAVVLVLSLAMPLSIPTPPVTMSAKLSLVWMHIIGAIVVVSILITLGRRSKR